MSNAEFEEWVCGRGLAGVAVLRRRAGLASSGDWDIAVKDLCSFRRELRDRFGEPDFVVAHRYVEQWHYPWNQVDLLPLFEWNGVEFLSHERFWSGIVRVEGLPCPRIAHDGFAAWMTGLLGGGVFREAYRPLVLEAWKHDRDELLECLQSAFGPVWADKFSGWLDDGRPEESTLHVGALRRCLWWGRMRREPFDHLARQFSHWWREFRNHLSPPYPWVAILGPDGSGKSTVIAGLRERLLRRRIGLDMIHWSPVFGAAKASPSPVVVEDPHGRPPRGPLMSVAKLVYLFLVWRFAWFWRLRHSRAKSKILLFDRYYMDMLVDSKRYRYGGPGWLARVCFGLLPKPDLVIFLLGDAKSIQARKREVGFEELERQLASYGELAARMGTRARRIDCCEPLDVVVESAYMAVIDTLKTRGRD